MDTTKQATAELSRISGRLDALRAEREATASALRRAEEALDAGTGTPGEVATAQAAVDAVESAVGRMEAERGEALACVARCEAADARADALADLGRQGEEARACLDAISAEVDYLNDLLVQRLATVGVLMDSHAVTRKQFLGALHTMYPEHPLRGGGGIPSALAEELGAAGVDVDALAYAPVAGRPGAKVPAPFGPMLYRAIETAVSVATGTRAMRTPVGTGEAPGSPAERLAARLHSPNAAERLAGLASPA